jgi:DNA-binding response OmpR family regulator
VKILIIEDTDQVSKFLKLKIEKWGHKAIVAETGKEALDIIETEIFDLILLDIFLPDTIAYDLIPKLKKGWSGMEIITMTGHSSRDVEKKVRRQGILYYMVKPIDLAELKSILQHMAKNPKYRN